MDRVHPSARRLRADPDWDTVLLVLHGGVNCAILSLALTGQRLFLGGLAQAPAASMRSTSARRRDWVVRCVNYARRPCCSRTRAAPPWNSCSRSTASRADFPGEKIARSYGRSIFMR
jgi:hypothetical protein